MTRELYRCADCVEEGKEGLFLGFKAMQEHRDETGHARHAYDYWRVDGRSSEND